MSPSEFRGSWTFHGSHATAGPELDALPGSPDHLPWVAKAERIEHIPEAPHLLEIRFRVELAHVVDLLDANAVLAGERAADAYNQLQDCIPGRAHTLDGAGLALVVEDHGVEVAVTG